MQVDPFQASADPTRGRVFDGYVRMIVTLSHMHDATTTAMQREGFTSQLSKLDRRFAAQG